MGIGERIEGQRGVPAPPERREGLGTPGERAFVRGRPLEGRVERAERVRDPAQARQHRAAAGQGQRAIGRQHGRFLVRLERHLEPAAERRDMTAAEGVLVALVGSG